MQIRETERRREDGEWYVTDDYFIYSSLQLLSDSHYFALSH